MIMTAVHTLITTGFDRVTVTTGGWLERFHLSQVITVYSRFRNNFKSAGEFVPVF